MSVKDEKTAPWIVDVARTAYAEGFRRALEGAGRLNESRDKDRAVRCFEIWWDTAAGLVVAEVVPDAPTGGDERNRHDDDQDGLERVHAPGSASTDPRTWADGVKDSIKIVEYRQRHYELYRAPGLMQTKPEVFATIDELLIFLKAMLERGEYRSRIPVDGGSDV